jgi:hypothetical protein
MIPAAYIAKKMANKKAYSGNTLPGTRDNGLDDIKEKAVAIGLTALGIGAAFFVGRKIYKNIREKRTERRFTEESQQALLLRSAMNPSGASWLIWMDGTKEEAIFNIAAQITNFRKVQQDYQNLYNRSLLKDLQKELKTDEYNKFMNIINSGSIQNSNVQGGNSPGYSPLPTGSNAGGIQGKVILIEKDTKIYEKFTWYPFGSVRKAEKGYFINHLTTGEIKKVNAGYGIVIPFVEVRIKTVEGMVKTVYVKQSDVKLVSKEDFLSNYQNRYTKLVFRDDDF